MAANGSMERVFALNFDTRVLLAGSLLAGVLLLGAIIIAFVRRQVRGEDAPADAGDELSRYRAMFERGEISEEEFLRLRSLLTGEIRKTSGLPARKPPGSGPANVTDAPKLPSPPTDPPPAGPSGDERVTPG